MSQEKNIAVAHQLLAGLGDKKEPGVIAAMFDENVIFEIPGDAGAPPWIGRQTGRQAIGDFIRDLRTLTESIRFEVQDVLASDSRVILVEFVTRIKTTGKVIESPFAMILTVSGDRVTRFRMLEDSFALSVAARV